MTAAHYADPKRATLRSEATDMPASRHNIAAYPLVAECRTCDQPIRIETYQGRGWQHVVFGPQLPTRTPQASGHTPAHLSPALHLQHLQHFNVVLAIYMKLKLLLEYEVEVL